MTFLQDSILLKTGILRCYATSWTSNIHIMFMFFKNPARYQTWFPDAMILQFLSRSWEDHGLEGSGKECSRARQGRTRASCCLSPACCWFFPRRSQQNMLAQKSDPDITWLIPDPYTHYTFTLITKWMFWKIRLDFNTYFPCDIILVLAKLSCFKYIYQTVEIEVQTTVLPLTSSLLNNMNM